MTPEEQQDRLAELVHEAMPDADEWQKYFRRIEEWDGWWLEIQRTLSQRIAARLIAAHVRVGDASPFGFNVTDADMDASDGARMTFERHGGRWEPAEAVRVGPDEGLRAVRLWLRTRDAAKWDASWPADFRNGYDAAVEEVRALVSNSEWEPVEELR